MGDLNQIDLTLFLSYQNGSLHSIKFATDYILLILCCEVTHSGWIKTEFAVDFVLDAQPGFSSNVFISNELKQERYSKLQK